MGGLGFWWDVGGGWVVWFGGDGLLRVFSVGAPAVEEPDSSDDNCGFEWYADKCVGDAAMVLEGCDGAVDGPEGVDVGGLGGDGHGEGGVGGLAVEAGAGEDGSGHEVGDGFHVFHDSSLFGRCVLPDGPTARGAVTS